MENTTIMGVRVIIRRQDSEVQVRRGKLKIKRYISNLQFFQLGRVRSKATDMLWASLYFGGGGFDL